jgi:hypothetical protein
MQNDQKPIFDNSMSIPLNTINILSGSEDIYVKEHIIEVENDAVLKENQLFP